ncbi:MAG: hypothetical protein JRJ03_15100 [Deltaproteobacteria bacterium]|nr:hypothetical protein [Deltaproteobacteria bacterium]MBW2066239.1 hypothetical protein [Deltaproteobacteria bacterium]
MAYREMDRFMDALNGEPRDRVPIFPMLSAWSVKNFSDLPISRLAFEPGLVVEAKIWAKEAMGYDAFFAYAEPSPISEAYGCKERFGDRMVLGGNVDPVNSLLLGDKDAIRSERTLSGAFGMEEGPGSC